MKGTLLSIATWLIYRIWSCTWRTEIVEHPDTAALRDHSDRRVFAHWHGDELAIVQLVGRYRIATMTSTSRDGQLMDRVIRLLGGATCRGSSTRGGVGALKSLVRLCRSGYNASMAVDGPRGPIHRVKPGVFHLARLARGTIVPVGVASSRTHVFRSSWNRAQLPKPFARVVVYFGPPYVPDDEDPQPHGDRPAAELALALERSRQQARSRLSPPPLAGDAASY